MARTALKLRDVEPDARVGIDGAIVVEGAGRLSISESSAPPRPRDSVRRRGLAVADVLSLCLAFGIVWLVTAPSVRGSDALFVAAMLPVWVFLNKLLRLYDRDANLIHRSTLDEVPEIVLSIALGTGLAVLVAAPLTGVEVDRTQVVVFMATAVLAVPLLRSSVRGQVTRHYPPERCLVVGSGFVGDLVARKIRSHPEYGVELIGFVDVPGPDLDVNGGLDRLLGDLERFEEICREFSIERVLIAFSTLHHEDLIEVIRSSKALGLKITVVPRLFEIIGHSVEVDHVEGMPLMGLRGFARTRSSLVLKRGIDVIGATVGLVILSPLLLTAALAIKLTSRGPVLFVQRRVGRGNQHFGMYKFRTMVQGADELKADLEHQNEAEMPMFKISDDPRVTRVGRLLRRFSLDELPQLWNVVKGEMSLVGPRPLVPSEDAHVIGRHRDRLDLTPGLTGPWQVMGRNGIPFQEMIKLDYLYVAEWSLWNDLKLLIRTAPIVLGARGH